MTVFDPESACEQVVRITHLALLLYPESLIGLLLARDAPSRRCFV